MLSESEITITSIGSDFEILARDVDALLSVAASTISQLRTVQTIPAKVKCLVTASNRFIQKRFEATSAILNVVKDEQKLLERLSQFNAGSRRIARETRMLGLLTSIESARLGESG